MNDYEKPTVHTDALDTLGSIIGPEEKRDAIHLAVFPAHAAHVLLPGQHVVLTDDGLAYAVPVGAGIGIVDPFLTSAVKPGERFWLVVYPRQISSLRHVWEHPSFPPSGENDATTVTDATDARKDAEAWLRRFVGQGDLPGFDEVIETAAYSARNQLDYVTLGTDGYGEIPAEFWGHLEVYLGEKFPPGRRADYFSCAC